MTKKNTPAAPKTIRQLKGQDTMRANTDKIREFFALEKAGDTAGAQALYAGLSDGLKRGIDNARAARNGQMSEKSQAQVDQTRALFGSVKASDVEGTIAAFGRFSEKARPGVLKTLGQMVSAGRVTPQMAETIGTLAA